MFSPFVKSKNLKLYSPELDYEPQDGLYEPFPYAHTLFL